MKQIGNRTKAKMQHLKQEWLRDTLMKRTHLLFLKSYVGAFFHPRKGEGVMEILNFIMAVLVACGVCRAILEHLGISKFQKYFKFPFHVLARIVLSPLEIILYLIHICFLANPLTKEKQTYGKRKKRF